MPVNPKPGDVFKFLGPDGRIAYPGHLFVILCVSGEKALFSNVTDIENEVDIPCLLEPKDAPEILTIISTFRYQNIREWPVAVLTRAFAEDRLLYCGVLPNAALQKILTGAATSRLIKPRYRVLLR